MGVILLKLAGPLQSWGADSRFTERKTRHEPTKSGVVGLLAAALGRRREDSVDDLAALSVAVRVDQPGRYERDFQTAHPRSYRPDERRWGFSVKAGKIESLPLSHRYYLADAVFVAGIEVADELLVQYGHALDHPAFPLFLGRRSCPPSCRVLLGARAGVGLMQALAEQPWEAADGRVRRAARADEVVRLDVLRDALPGDDATLTCEAVCDVPLDFSQLHRRYGWRDVVRDSVCAPNPWYEQPQFGEHDPLALLEEVEG